MSLVTLEWLSLTAGLRSKLDKWNVMEQGPTQAHLE
jgi:hypothetical protein